MNEVIIPEIVDTPRVQKEKKPNQLLNIHVNNKIDQRKYDYDIHHSFTQNNNTIINNNRKGGLFSFIFDLATLPVRLISKGVKFVFVKYDLKNKFQLEKIAIKKDKLKRKFLLNSRKAWDMEEIF